MNVIWKIGQISGLGPDAVLCATIPHTVSQRVFINELKSLHGGNKQLQATVRVLVLLFGVIFYGHLLKLCSNNYSLTTPRCRLLSISSFAQLSYFHEHIKNVNVFSCLNNE